MRLGGGGQQASRFPAVAGKGTLIEPCSVESVAGEEQGGSG